MLFQINPDMLKELPLILKKRLNNTTQLIPIRKTGFIILVRLTAASPAPAIRYEIIIKYWENLIDLQALH